MTTTLTRTITVAAGVFAPGHLGELTRYLPFELVDDVLAQTGTTQQRLRALPSPTGVYFVLALGLFPQIGYARVWAKLCAGLVAAGLVVPAVSEKALRELRRRLGRPRLRRCLRWLPDRWRSPGPRACALRGCARSLSMASIR
jgi:Insertion element 4 transposase N-terminal